MKFDLTPVENVKGLWIKREDKFAPFGAHSVNGGKLRQCFSLVDSVKDEYKGLVTFCGIHSPQGGITSAVANHYGLKCYIFYGGTTKESLQNNNITKIIKEYGAQIKIVAKTGRHNVLRNKAIEYAKENGYFVVEYGFNIVKYPDLLLNAVSSQVENIPDEIDNLIVTCGSGITSTGILLGLKRYKKKVNTIHLVDTAPNRMKNIQSNLSNYGIDCSKEFNIKVHDLYNQKGFVYEKGIRAVYNGIAFHPQYEAKTFSWLYYQSGIDIHNGANLFWVVGAEPFPNVRK